MTDNITADDLQHFVGKDVRANNDGVWPSSGPRTWLLAPLDHTGKVVGVVDTPGRGVDFIFKYKAMNSRKVEEEYECRIGFDPTEVTGNSAEGCLRKTSYLRRFTIVGAGPI